MVSKTISVVVIGGSYAGIGVSHGILRRIPTAIVFLINPSNESYFNLASPRIIANPGAIPPNKYLFSIQESFQHYPQKSFHFIKGVVTSIEPQKQLVNIANATISSLNFDYLVIASGSTTFATLGEQSSRIPFKPNAVQDIRSEIREAQEKVYNASSIVIGGGGPLGVEFAGELTEADSFGKKNVTLVSATEILPMMKAKAQKRAQELLEGRGVRVITLTTVQAAAWDSTSEKWTLSLSDGQSLLADVYVSASGVIPNNSFIPRSLLNKDGWVKVNEYLRVDNTELGGGGSIYALGDITEHPYRLLSRIPDQVSAVVANLQVDMTNEGNYVTYRPEEKRFMMIVPVGKSTGTGQIGESVLWGCLVSFFKGKDYLTSKAPGFLSG